MDHHITIVRIRRPAVQGVNVELQWLGESLGLFGSRDRDKSCFRIFIELLKASKHERALSSDELADHLELARGTVVHHVNNLMENGIVVQERKKYRLREEDLVLIMKKLKDDMEKTFQDIEKTASEVDKLLGFNNE